MKTLCQMKYTYYGELDDQQTRHDATRDVIT